MSRFPTGEMYLAAEALRRDRQVLSVGHGNYLVAGQVVSTVPGAVCCSCMRPDPCVHTTAARMLRNDEADAPHGGFATRMATPDSEWARPLPGFRRLPRLDDAQRAVGQRASRDRWVDACRSGVTRFLKVCEAAGKAARRRM